jgi:hypothetical protein
VSRRSSFQLLKGQLARAMAVGQGGLKGGARAISVKCVGSRKGCRCKGGGGSRSGEPRALAWDGVRIRTFPLLWQESGRDCHCE